LSVAAATQLKLNIGKSEPFTWHTSITRSADPEASVANSLLLLRS